MSMQFTQVQISPDCHLYNDATDKLKLPSSSKVLQSVLHNNLTLVNTGQNSPKQTLPSLCHLK